MDNKIIEKFEFKAEMKQLLNLIVHSLYTHPEIFLRELVSNSSDALNKLRILSLNSENNIQLKDELKITIFIDEKNNYFSIEDNGIGMTKQELIDQIGSIASSGTLKFLEELKKNNKNTENLIGQFGVGFYSVFMVTNEVIIETKSAIGDGKSYRWISKGESDYTIEEIEKNDIGTIIKFNFKEEAKEFASEYKLKEILNKYSNFIDFPIYLNNKKINNIQAIWYKKKDEIKEEEAFEFYKFISNDYDNPLDYFTISVEGNLNFKSLLFIPSNAPFNLFQDISNLGLQLYCNKVLIQSNNTDLLPEYLRFLRGVLDSEDISLNVSREMLQNTPILSKIRNVLTSKVLNHLEDLKKNNLELFTKYFSNFGSLLKTGVTSDYQNRDKILDLLLFKTNKTTDKVFTDFNGYVSRMLPDQQNIFYITGTNLENVKNNPNLEYFNKNNLEVIFFTDPIDVFILPYIGEYDNKKIVSIEKEDLDIKANNIENQNNLNQLLIQFFKDVLKDKVEDVRESKRLIESPFTLVLGKNSLDPQYEKMMKIINKDFVSTKKILEINPNHQLIKNLNKYIISNEKEKLTKIVNHIYDTALLNDGIMHNTKEYIDRLIEIMIEATN